MLLVMEERVFVLLLLIVGKDVFQQLLFVS